MKSNAELSIHWSLNTNDVYIQVEGDLTQKNIETMRGLWLDKPVESNVRNIVISMNMTRKIDYYCMHHLLLWLSRYKMNGPKMIIQSAPKSLIELMLLCQVDQWAEISK